MNLVKGGPKPKVGFQKAGAVVTGDFLAEAPGVGSLAMDTTDGDLYVCTNATTAAWSKVGLQT